MTSQDKQDFDEKNRKILSEFIMDAAKNDDDLSGSVIATITQFILNMRISIKNKAREANWVTPCEIIQSQIDELRRCVIDLESYKDRLIKGVTHQ